MQIRADILVIVMNVFWIGWGNNFVHLLLCHMPYRTIQVHIFPDSYMMYLYIVKCTLVQALRLCTGCMAHRGSRGIALLFLDHDTRRGWGVNFTPRPLFMPGKDPVPIGQAAGWAPGLLWTGGENLSLTGIRSPDRPARSQSLYQLRYPAHTFICTLMHLTLVT